jgi:hypothetical protein
MVGWGWNEPVPSKRVEEEDLEKKSKGKENVRNYKRSKEKRLKNTKNTKNKTNPKEVVQFRSTDLVRAAPAPASVEAAVRRSAAAPERLRPRSMKTNGGGRSARELRWRGMRRKEDEVESKKGELTIGGYL